MNKLLFTCLALLLTFFSNAQNPIEIGKAVNNSYVITADTVVLRKAIQSTLNDGTQITEMHIESVGKWHYLVATGIQRNYRKTIAIELTYTINDRSYWVKEGLLHKTCASAGCNNCTLLKENGNIIGCHCKDENTVSNECNFKTIAQSPFYRHLTRYLHLKK